MKLRKLLLHWDWTVLLGFVMAEETRVFSMDPVGIDGRENWPESTVSLPEGVVVEIPYGESV